MTFELSSKCVPALAARAPDRKVGPKLTITLANLKRILINQPINQLKTNKQHDNQPINLPGKQRTALEKVAVAVAGLQETVLEAPGLEELAKEAPSMEELALGGFV